MPLNGNNYVTIASDGSAGPKHRLLGMAYWIRDDEGSHRHAWRIALDVNGPKANATYAEVYAFYGAMQHFAKSKHPKGTKVIYYADCMIIIQILKAAKGEFTFQNRTHKRYVGMIELAKEIFAGMELDPRHVKAHTRGKDLPKRFYMNQWCDENARAMMRHNRLHIKRDWRKEKKS